MLYYHVRLFFTRSHRPKSPADLKPFFEKNAHSPKTSSSRKPEQQPNLFPELGQLVGDSVHCDHSEAYDGLSSVINYPMWNDIRLL